MKLHSYVVEHDFGFAPNPFFGVCTLAACKPRIREHAGVGDFLVETGCAKRRRRGHLVRVEEITSFDDYWLDPRFQCKRPNLRGSKMQAFGDNIYHRDPETGAWRQVSSFHSLRDGSPNRFNVDHDTQSSKVLIGSDFAYWGGCRPIIPEEFRNFNGTDICAKRGHGNRFPEGTVPEFIAWLRSLNERGYLGPPLDWVRSG